MANKLVFRFDVDTHKCIRDGVPNLLKIADARCVPFTFFLNLGKAVSIKVSLKNIFKENATNVEMMTAREKLGNKDYLYAALINPDLSRYKTQIIRMMESKCEIGIHGGRNHALWGKYAETWNPLKIKTEIEWALSILRKIHPSYQPTGFASPEWKTPEMLADILCEYNFKYYADLRCNNKEYIVERKKKIPNIGVNLVGEPGGVAFFENCRVKGLKTSQIISMVIQHTSENPYTVLYDHPYYAGTCELNTIDSIIQEAQDKGIEVVSMGSLI